MDQFQICSNYLREPQKFNIRDHKSRPGLAQVFLNVAPVYSMTSILYHLSSLL